MIRLVVVLPGLRTAMIQDLPAGRPELDPERRQGGVPDVELAALRIRLSRDTTRSVSLVFMRSLCCPSPILDNKLDNI